MPALLRHFSINADDLPRARAFYEAVCGWTFKAWGPPDFLLLEGAGVGGSLQARHTLAGRDLPGVEVTFGVDDIAAVTRAAEAGGATILMPEYDLQGVGRMITFEDADGVIAKACQYEQPWAPLPATGAAVLRHFAINADDVPRARRFYETLFDWTWTPWGPPGFYQTRDAGPGRLGALQQRRSIGGQAMPCIELSFGVADLAATIKALEANDGQLLMPPFRIDGVGELIFFRDSEGNVAGAMQYDEGNWE